MALNLTAKIGADASGFDAVLGRLNRSVSTFGAGLGARLGALFTVGAIAGLTRKTLEFADNLDETSTRLGVNVEKLQEWQYAAAQNGLEAERLTSLIEKLSTAAQDASKQKLFAGMGINPDGLTPQQLFESVARWSRGQSAATVTSTLSPIAGDRVAGVAVNTLRADLESLGDEARRMGAVMDTITTQALAKLNDQISVLGKIVYANFGKTLLELGKNALIAGYALLGVKDAIKKLETSGGVDKPPWYLLAAGHGPSLVKYLSQLAGAASVPQVADDAVAEFDKRLMDWNRAIDAINSATGGPDQALRMPARAAEKLRVQPISSDSLVGVGNFLGTGGLATIANRQLQIAQRQLEVSNRQESLQRSMSQNIDRLANTDGLGIPPS